VGKYVTVSAKVRRELKEEAERLGIKISEVIRRSLEEEVKRRKLEIVQKKLEDIKDTLEKLDVDRLVKHIREDRMRG